MTPNDLLNLAVVLIFNLLGWPALFWLWRKVSPYVDTSWKWPDMKPGKK